jgi:hypothetical protein
MSLGHGEVAVPRTRHGWQLTWILFSVIYLIAVAIATVLLLPDEAELQRERLKTSMALVDAYLASDPSFRETKPVLPTEYGGVPVHPTQIPRAISEMHKKYKGRVDFTPAETEFTKNQRDLRGRFLSTSFLFWFAPVALSYVIGLSVGWVLRGFTRA